ncbi:OOP family OmpA-OmpF porin [Pseudoclavibacter chungangensis]|nr:OOP family OmpA-OmpF porin [Pseudoclavibacter chungangensis]
MSVNVLGGGAGNRTAGDESLVLFGDGSGNYTKGGVSIVNHGDGSGNYSDGTLQIINYGDGTGLIDGVPYNGFEKIEPAPSVGAFPTMGAVAPIESCGIIISLESEVLFDFDRAEVRSDAAEVLRSLSRALTENAVPAAEIGGHTDSIGDPAYNLDLSERRAAAVVAALQANGTTSTLDAVGYGDTRPVAPNANEDGSDNPAGRQENRRVEVFVPAFT